MKKSNMKESYFNWMLDTVKVNERRLPYERLLRYLYDRPFDFTIGLDSNRAEDGINLRYHFARERGYSDPEIASYLDDRPCSVLEMMVALSIRCENIMENLDIGDRTSYWFWEMIKSLGLISMCDYRYDVCYVESAISCFLNHQYHRNGKGGLFTVHHSHRDMRSMEIWYQMCQYLNEQE